MKELTKQPAVKPTEEEKAQYFAQYLGTDTLVVPAFMSKDSNKVCRTTVLTTGLLDAMSDTCSYLQLTSLADITFEHAIEVAQLMGLTEGDFEIERSPSDIHINADGQEFTLFFDDCSIYFNDFNTDSANSGVDYLSAYDLLRSKGYALPFRYYSIQDLHDFGWLKLREKGGEQQ